MSERRLEVIEARFTPDLTKDRVLWALRTPFRSFTRGYRFPGEGAPVFLVVSLGDLSIGLTQAQKPEEVRRVDL
jgi:hypothetical protein